MIAQGPTIKVGLCILYTNGWGTNLGGSVLLTAGPEAPPSVALARSSSTTTPRLGAACERRGIPPSPVGDRPSDDLTGDASPGAAVGTAAAGAGCGAGAPTAIAPSCRRADPAANPGPDASASDAASSRSASIASGAPPLTAGLPRDGGHGVPSRETSLSEEAEPLATPPRPSGSRGSLNLRVP